MKKVSYWLSLPLLYLIAILPFPVLYFLSDIFKILIFDIVGYRKQVILTNLRNSFPNKSEKEINEISVKFQRNFTDMLLECVKMLTLTQTQLARRFKITNPEFLLKLQENNRGIIGVVGHVINWEWAGLIQSQSSPHATMIIYKPLENTFFDKLVLNMRSKFGAVLVPMKLTLRKLIEYKNKPYILVLAGDQYPGKGENVYKTTFLNQTTYVFLGTERTAKMMDAAVVFCSIKKVKRGHYAVTFELLEEHPKATPDGVITEKHIRFLEEQIIDQPDTWLWSHKRWK
ncbi:lysophospholipid acyltransferase family protein [Solitalea canadensis]|uniref:Lauroyl/myristoyl acyltransferase n=1 Tax=Solitalea canadensis (strain ATCC 29591 / DSM 3403 / JCM 21819 / LMG 8368 / NBRC 15130 / NCIMB 12057 / USAM 9D) TaxID=929556 RepID=H8KW01_SOLCM|nr:lysophospholipid acyltransferase family protein [Solitalea canadensis]AFD06904.1 Lauroyl/myristoyl acyltransferase [Solitalea canadensis DSM 3403]